MKRIDHLYKGKFLSYRGLHRYKGRRFVGSHKMKATQMQEWRSALHKESGLMFCFNRNILLLSTGRIYRMQKGEQKFVGNRKFIYRKKLKK